ncbi:MAG: response regulator [Candidatus Omnitrophica bacterium]|nr:response regulator [Candidatus Omnitrophota bacterium]
MSKNEKTILCVDDELSILKTLNRVLSGAGYKVALAQSGEEALKILDAQGVDLIIADQRMPEMTGSEFLRLAHQSHPGIVSIMLSGYSDFASLVDAVNEGEIFRFVAKPWSNEVLLEIVSSALAKRHAQNLAGILLGNIQSMVSDKSGIRVETSQTEDTVTIRVLEGGKLLSTEVIFAFLHNVFDVLGIKEDDRIRMISGAVAKQKGKVVLFINVGEGVVLNIEIPKPAGDA